jgi:hypothetical protein
MQSHSRSPACSWLGASVPTPIGARPTQLVATIVRPLHRPALLLRNNKTIEGGAATSHCTLV